MLRSALLAASQQCFQLTNGTPHLAGSGASCATCLTALPSLQADFDTQHAARNACSLSTSLITVTTALLPLQADFDAQLAERITQLESHFDAKLQEARAELQQKYDRQLAERDAEIEAQRCRCDELQEDLDQLLLCLVRLAGVCRGLGKCVSGCGGRCCFAW